jgi:hypothetical protein
LPKHPQRQKDDEEHLPYPGQYRNDAAFQRRLDNMFRRTSKLPALERLEILGREFGIGGAPPFITIRAEADDRQKKIVVRHSDDDQTVSTGIPAGDMTVKQASRHPDAKAFLMKFADEKLFEAQITNAPKTVKFSTAINRFLATQDPSTGDKKQDLKQRILSKERNIPDSLAAFNTMKMRAKVLIADLFKDRQLKHWNKNLGAEIKRCLERKRLKAGATRDDNGQISGATDGNAAAYYTIVRKTRDWLKDYHPPIAMPLAPFAVETKRSEPVMWDEARLIMLWCQGYVWDRKNGGFVRHWIERNGELRPEYKKLEVKELAEHRAKYAPLLCAIPVFMTTGTRPEIGKRLGWLGIRLGWSEKEQYRPGISLSGALSEIRRAGSKGPSPKPKPRDTSLLLPIARRFFEVRRIKDARQAEKDKWPERPGGYYVIHDGRGGLVTNISALFTQACNALGIENSVKKMKHGLVTHMYLAGFELFFIGTVIGNNPVSTHDYYLYLEAKYQVILRPPPDQEMMRWVDLMDPHRSMPKIPRAPLPPRPATRVAATPPAEAPPRG